MNDRTRWEQSPTSAQDQGRTREQQGWHDSRRDEQAPTQSHGPSQQPRAGEGWSGQQGGWHDDDRPQDWHSGGAYGQRDGGWSAQPQQREWRGADRAWGGSSQRGGYAARDEEAGYSASRAYRPDSDRPDPRQSADEYGRWGSVYRGANDGPGRAYPGGRDDWRTPGSQGFAGSYGMIDGPGPDRMGGRYASGTGGAGNANPEAFGRGYGPDYGRDEGRGLLDRAGDAIASWFGDDDAAQRRDRDQRGDYRDYRQGADYGRDGGHRGKGPADYTRSDDRIREDANDRLTDDHRIDASRISVAVAKGEITLNGTVGSRADKRRAEDCVDGIPGVRHVQNNLRVEDGREQARTASSPWGSSAAAEGSGKAVPAGTNASAGGPAASPAGTSASGSAATGKTST